MKDGGILALTPFQAHHANKGGAPCPPLPDWAVQVVDGSHDSSLGPLNESPRTVAEGIAVPNDMHTTLG